MFHVLSFTDFSAPLGENFKEEETKKKSKK